MISSKDFLSLPRLPMCYRLSTFEVVRVNCEMFRESDNSVLQAWNNPDMRMNFHGFMADSVKDVHLKRLFTTNILNYMFIHVQRLLGMFVTDTNLSEDTFINGVFLTRDSDCNRREFRILKTFRIYNDRTCRATNHYLTVTATVHEDPEPWIVAVKIDMCKIENGKEYLVDSINR